VTIVKQREAELILRAARLYYEGHYSQDQVASKLNTSRSNVSRMLSDAKRLGFVEIKIVSPTHKHEALSAQLSELLKINDVQVITSEANDLTLNTVGRAAASALLKHLRDNQTIAISWGRGLEATVVNTHSETLSGLKVTQLMGSLSSVNTSVSAEEVGRNLAKNLNAQFIPFLSPVVVSNAKTRDSLLEEESIAKTLRLARTAHVALVGIGSAGSSSSEMVFEEFKSPKAQRDERRPLLQERRHPVVGSARCPSHRIDARRNQKYPACNRGCFGCGKGFGRGWGRSCRINRYPNTGFGVC